MNGPHSPWLFTRITNQPKVNLMRSIAMINSNLIKEINQGKIGFS